MRNPVLAILDLWRRRLWQPGPGLARFEGLEPAVVVTGASEGIGLELARCFVAEGRTVLLVARGRARLEAAARNLAIEHKGRVIALAADVTTADALQAVDAALARERCYCDVLVNNAGIGLSGSFAGNDPAVVAGLLDLNVRALTLLCRHMLPGMLVRGRGGILNIASVGSFVPGPYQAVYYASKAYVLSLTEAIAEEVAGQGVRITALAPGPVATAFTGRMGAEASPYMRLVPLLTPGQAARSGHRAFRWGQRVAVAGLFNVPLALAIRAIPNRMLLPIVGWLLWPGRGKGSKEERDVRR
ncbi:MAG: SDR family NAD(P)-dependent oxidoreductase [Hyphomicrobiaceae bacterium]